jgi:putative oxidoreductase
MRAYNPSTGLFVLRIVVGFIFLMHGLGKLIGPPFLGPGMGGWEGMVAGLGLPLPGVLAWLAMLVETLGGIALILGSAVSITALLLIGDMLVAIWKVHLANGLNNGSGGYEYNLVLIGALACLMLGGPGIMAVQVRPRLNASA